MTHYVPMAPYRARVVPALCGQFVHTRELKTVHQAMPECPTCRSLLADEDASDPSPCSNSSEISDGSGR